MRRGGRSARQGSAREQAVVDAQSRGTGEAYSSFESTCMWCAGAGSRQPRVLGFMRVMVRPSSNRGLSPGIERGEDRRGGRGETREETGHSVASTTGGARAAAGAARNKVLFWYSESVSPAQPISVAGREIEESASRFPSDRNRPGIVFFAACRLVPHTPPPQPRKPPFRFLGILPSRGASSHPRARPTHAPVGSDSLARLRRAADRGDRCARWRGTIWSTHDFRWGRCGPASRFLSRAGKSCQNPARSG